MVGCELALADLGDPAAAARAAWAGLGKLTSWDVDRLNRAIAIIDRVLREVRAGRVVEVLSARARARTEHDLRALALSLVDQGGDWVAMAVVVAGAALELRLRRVAQGRVEVREKSTLGQMFKTMRDARPGVATIDPSDDGLIQQWIDMRNDAAHRMTAFPRSAEQVRADLGPLEAFLKRAPIEKVVTHADA